MMTCSEVNLTCIMLVPCQEVDVARRSKSHGWQAAGKKEKEQTFIQTSLATKIDCNANLESPAACETDFSWLPESETGVTVYKMSKHLSSQDEQAPQKSG
jgi:hypothetical protein